MNGKEILVDTNIIIYLLQGDDTLEEILQAKRLYVSFITELELLGFYAPTKEYEKQIQKVLSDCIIVPLNNDIKIQYKSIRKAYHKMKLADSLVGATALSLNIPMITADKQFKIIKALQLIQYER
jgi:predicted nucleic acid-binding protein